MSKPTDKNLFMFPSLSVSRFYQELFRGALNYRELADTLIRKAELAHSFRWFDTVKEVGQILFNFPLKEYSSIGMYFIGVAFNSCGNGDQGEAKTMFERVIDSAPDRYKAKALLSLGAVSFNTGDYDSALYFYNETIKAAPLDSASIQAIRTVAILKSMAGDHQGAIKDLENLCSLIRYAPPHIYFDCLNSLAVELGEVGRKYEARNIIKYVLASSYAFAYPEWRETGEDLREANRSFVVIDPSPLKARNVLSMPTLERDGAEFPTWAGQPAPVVNYQKWKQLMVKKKKKNGNKPIEEMSESDMLMEIMNVYTSDDITEEQRRKIYIAVMKAISEPDAPDTPEKPNDSDPIA